jgi:DNA repair protein RecN (Recombination protein N)
MLKKLALQNLATISDTTLDLSDGLNVLTGETGAGKSILIDGLLLTLGERADTGLIRPGAQAASVEAVFGLSDGSELLVRREVHAAGRSRMFLDDELTTLDEARQRLFGLVDLHTQRSSPELLRMPAQMAALDEYAGAANQASAVSFMFERCRISGERLNQLRDSLGKDSGEKELVRHELGLFETLNPSRADFESHVAERRELEQVRAGSELLFRVTEGIGGDDGLLDRLRAFQAELARSSLCLPSVLELLEQAGIAMEEARSLCTGLLSRIEEAPWRLEEIHQRLDGYSDLLARCGGSIDSLLLHREELKVRLQVFEAMERERADLEASIPADLTMLANHAAKLTGMRKAAAGKLMQSVQAELRLLAMPDAVFDISFASPREADSLEAEGVRVSSRGAELPEFLFSANRGMTPGPLSDVASGGELSRMSLALKLALAAVTQPPTMVFDEIDSGVGGETAGALADSLRRASLERQVIVITHLARIAALADRHLTVSKEQRGELPFTEVSVVASREDRIAELARALGGGAAATAHAEQLLDEADADRIGGPRG